MNFQERYSNFLMHHGIKGMKWGVWNDETKARYVGGSGKNFSDKDWKKAGFRVEHDEYGSTIYHPKIMSKSANKNIKEVDVTAEKFEEADKMYGNKMISDEALASLTNDVAKNPDKYFDIYAKKMADYFFDKQENEPWLYNGSAGPDEGYTISGYSKEQKKKLFIQRLGGWYDDVFSENSKFHGGYLSFRIMPDGTGEINVDDGGAFFGHFLSADVNFMNPEASKINWVSVNG